MKNTRIQILSDREPFRLAGEVNSFIEHMEEEMGIEVMSVDTQFQGDRWYATITYFFVTVD